MRTLHLVYGLYFTVLSMVSESPFYQYHTDMYQSTRLIGGLAIEKFPGTTPSNTSIGAIDYISTTNATILDSTSYSSGLGTTIILPDMNITYEYIGPRFNSRDLYTAVLDGLAEASKSGMDTVCVDVRAYSYSGEFIFWIIGEQSATHPLTYKAATDIFRSITLDMTLEQRRFEEINFFVMNRTEAIATGFVGKVPVQGNGTASVAAARRRF